MEVSIFNYFDYRRFLRDYLRQEASSLAMLCRKAPGFSKAHLSLVMSGKRNLGSEKIETLGKALNLKSAGLRYFQFLVRFNQARSLSEQEIYLRELIPSRPKKTEKNLQWDEYLALRNWRCLAIRELIRLPGFDPNPLILSKRFRSCMKPEDAKESMELLLRTGLISKNETGIFKVTEETLRTSDEVQSTVIQSYHASCFDLAKHALEKEPLENREFSSVNLVLTVEEFRWLKNRLKSFREEVVSAEGDHSGPRQLFQINVQLFPIAE